MASVNGKKEGPFVHQILARNIFTGEIFIFRDAEQANDYTKVSNGHILNHCNSKTVVATSGYNFRFYDTGTLL